MFPFHCALVKFRRRIGKGLQFLHNLCPSCPMDNCIRFLAVPKELYIDPLSACFRYSVFKVLRDTVSRAVCWSYPRIAPHCTLLNFSANCPMFLCKISSNLFPAFHLTVHWVIFLPIVSCLSVKSCFSFFFRGTQCPAAALAPYMTALQIAVFPLAERCLVLSVEMIYPPLLLNC